MIATTIEQSKHLLELGLAPKTADMFYFSYGMFRPMKLHVGKILEDVVTEKRQWAIPAWSLDALLEVIKKNSTELVCIEDKWYCGTIEYDTEYYPNKVDAVYEMVCWILKTKNNEE